MNCYLLLSKLFATKFATKNVFAVLLVVFGAALVFAQSLNIKTVGKILALEYNTLKPKTFMYSALPYKSDCAAALNTLPIERPTFNTEKIRGYFSVQTDKIAVAFQFMSGVPTKVVAPKRVLLYVVGTDAYQKTMLRTIKTFKNNAYPKDGTKIVFKTFPYLYAQHSDKTMTDFAAQILPDDAIIFCHQDTIETGLYTKQNKERDGRVLLNTSANHILRLYEHFNTKTTAHKAENTMESNQKLWFEGAEDVFIDYTEKGLGGNNEPLPYFVAQFAKAKGADWRAILQSINDKNTVVKAWENGAQLH